MSDITEFPAYGVTEFTTTMSELSLKTDPLAPNDIAIDVTHCGICHSDVHHLEGDVSLCCFFDPCIPIPPVSVSL
jgi:uncharacterized zinc-type alcohol dehydrogenase-like protein